MRVQHLAGELLGVPAATSGVQVVAEYVCSIYGLGFSYCMLSSKLSIPKEGNTPHGSEAKI